MLRGKVITMIIARVIGNVWATRKDEQLSGFKFMVVQPLDYSSQQVNGSTFVAVDQIGAGVGEVVLIVQGSSARRSVEKENLPVDASIIGIIEYFIVVQYFLSFYVFIQLFISKKKIIIFKIIIINFLMRKKKFKNY